MNLSVIAILYIKGSDYYFIISLISKNGYKLNAKCWFDQKSPNIIKYKNLLPYIKMGREILTFGDIEIEKNKFYHHKTTIFLKDIGIENELL